MIMLEKKDWGALAVELQRIKSSYEKSFYYREDPDTSLIHARKSAEAICKQIYRQENLEKGAKPADKLMLNDLIQALNRKKCIPQYISINLGTIQVFGNFGTHDQGEDIHYATPESIMPCLQALTTVMKWYFGEYHENEIYFKPIELTENSSIRGTTRVPNMPAMEVTANIPKMKQPSHTHGTEEIIPNIQGIAGRKKIEQPIGVIKKIGTVVTNTFFLAVIIVVGLFIWQWTLPFAPITVPSSDIVEEDTERKEFVINRNLAAPERDKESKEFTTNRNLAVLEEDNVRKEPTIDTTTPTKVVSISPPRTKNIESEPPDARNLCVNKNKIHAAAMDKDFNMIETCLRSGVNVDVREESNGWTLLHAAAFGGDPEIVRLLLSSGASVNALDQQQRTPMYYAVEANNAVIVSILEQNGGQ